MEVNATINFILFGKWLVLKSDLARETPVLKDFGKVLSVLDENYVAVLILLEVEINIFEVDLNVIDKYFSFILLLGSF